MALLALSVGCGGETVTVAEPQDDTDTVTLAQAMASTGTEDAGLFGHSVGRAAPGIPPFDPDIPGDVWDAVEADVRQHVFWHTDDRFTVHALSAGREKITSGPRLDDPVVYEDPEPVDVARAVGSLDAFRVGGGRAPAPNQSFLAKQMQTRIAACISTVVQELSNRARVSPVPWQVPDNVLWQPIGWRIGNQHFDYRPVPGQDRASGPYASITFSNARWDPSYSKVNYGTKTIAQDVRVSDTGKTKLIQNDSDGYVGVSYTESEAITNAFSSTVTHGMTLDMTASSTTTVGGEYAGVSAEQSITLEFGVSTTDEESQEKSEEGDQ